MIGRLGRLLVFYIGHHEDLPPRLETLLDLLQDLRG